MLFPFTPPGRDRSTTLDERARFDLALNRGDEPRGNHCRLSLREKPSLAQGFDRGIKLLSLGFDDPAELSLVCSLAGPNDRKAFDRLPRHLLFLHPEPIRDQLVPC